MNVSLSWEDEIKWLAMYSLKANLIKEQPWKKEPPYVGKAVNRGRQRVQSKHLSTNSDFLRAALNNCLWESSSAFVNSPQDVSERVNDRARQKARPYQDVVGRGLPDKEHSKELRWRSISEDKLL